MEREQTNNYLEVASIEFTLNSQELVGDVPNKAPEYYRISYQCTE